MFFNLIISQIVSKYPGIHFVVLNVSIIVRPGVYINSVDYFVTIARTSAICVKKPRGRPLLLWATVDLSLSSFPLFYCSIKVGCERVWCIITLLLTNSLICINFKTKSNSLLLSNPLCATNMYVCSVSNRLSITYLLPSYISSPRFQKINTRYSLLFLASCTY